MKITFEDLLELLPDTPIARLANDLPEKIAHGLSEQRWANLKKWIPEVENLPDFGDVDFDLNAHDLAIGKTHPISEEQRDALRHQLKSFMPWRKGPFSVMGIDIDTEWRSDWKWDRVSPHISPLKYRYVLDVGCGSGYHCWRMAGEGASMVVGIEPSPLSNMQYWSIRHFIGANNVYMLPLTLEEVPANVAGFDTVFSMGVLYHRRSPIDHLYQLKACMKQGSELVLETLVVNAPEGTDPLGYSLVPEDRYAQMRNVWFLPTVETLTHWMQRVGFKDIKVVDVDQTSLEEQRTTEWMNYQSLKDFLDPDDINKTAEGYQAPTRATFVARL
ncbi:tRNA 5-methoxyuridine(34)/uridine 5-oxyacetic acid(34) synthase CmoB [Litoribrevibacter albus]|uniref:tRNA U34 carboxymethyltransferase n=1 Tax=Litoribrevibacter albus TaxID=1473156 RepID=A0AA37S7D3_9GAMM|nr:tRNA 5-methoxyuridine(34)/uridine 5-oxyacetic acid(34) synthase CmoB [Litoribrevibacter albus]GLQ29874.1 tRNA U34 carboxymethyltransferase [Litoribrevibacter albus]